MNFECIVSLCMKCPWYNIQSLTKSQKEVMQIFYLAYFVKFIKQDYIRMLLNVDKARLHILLALSSHSSLVWQVRGSSLAGGICQLVHSPSVKCLTYTSFAHCPIT